MEAAWRRGAASCCACREIILSAFKWMPRIFRELGLDKSGFIRVEGKDERTRIPERGANELAGRRLKHANSSRKSSVFIAQVLSCYWRPGRRWAYTVRQVFSGMNGDPISGILFNHGPSSKGG